MAVIKLLYKELDKTPERSHCDISEMTVQCLFTTDRKHNILSSIDYCYKCLRVFLFWTPVDF